MKFNDIEKINGQNIFKIDNYISGDKEIIVFDVKEEFSPNIFNEYVDFLLEGGTLVRFDEKRNVINDIYGDIILLEYNDKKARDNDYILMDKNIDIINSIKSKEIDGNRQIAEPIGKLDLNGKYYLFLYPYNGTTSEINPELGIYKGVIVNPELYFGKIGEEVRQVEDKVDDILG